MSMWEKYKVVFIMGGGLLVSHVGWLLVQYDEKLVSPEERKKLPLGLGQLSFLESHKSGQDQKK
ncbi:hypothetical protein WDU94_009729 [Cyamophila willieti]